MAGANNHITNTGFNYDPAGDLLWDGGSNYEYDAEGRVKHSYSTGQWQYPMYNALGQRVEDYQGTDPMTLTYPRDILGQRTGTFAQWPSQNWTGWNRADLRIPRATGGSELSAICGGSLHVLVSAQLAQGNLYFRVRSPPEKLEPVMAKHILGRPAQRRREEGRRSGGPWIQMQD